MGSSVFHGAFSTFLAVGMMGFARLYTFVVFFKTWLFIIAFGVVNGMILLPILLSMIGPVDQSSDVQESQQSQSEPNKNLKLAKEDSEA